MAGLSCMSVASTYALSAELLDRFASNNILFYDPDGNCGSSGGNGVVTILEGNNVAEKVWNWFASSGIVGVSDNASVIAGIIGNLMSEAGGNTFDINPFIVSSDGYYGMYQAGKGRATALQNAFTRADLSSYWGSSLSSVPEEIIDKAVDVTLTELTTGDDGSFHTFVSKLGTVSENKPESYAELFVVIVEVAIYGEYEIQDPGVKPLAGGNKYQAGAKRTKNAVTAFEAFSGNTGGGSVTGIQSNTSSVLCYGINGELVPGGMTIAEAQEFMQAYRSITPRNYDDPGGDILKQWSINNVGGCYSDLENCVAFTQWFICVYTGVCMPLGNGGGVAKQLVDSGRGFTSGNQPRPYAVFSIRRKSKDCTSESCGHTGVVLGVDEERGKIILGEAGCGMSFDWTNAHEDALSKYTNGNYEYAYTDAILKGL